MTWSIIGVDEGSRALAVAAATRFFAVGTRVPYVASGVGAIATQALVNPYYGIDGLTLLRSGHPPADVLHALLAKDPGSSHRPAHIIDAAGRLAVHTGCDCLERKQAASLGRSMDHVVADNRLAGCGLPEHALQRAEDRPIYPQAQNRTSRSSSQDRMTAMPRFSNGVFFLASAVFL